LVDEPAVSIACRISSAAINPRIRVFHMARKSLAFASDNRNENEWSSSDSLSVSEMSESRIACILKASARQIVQMSEKGVSANLLTPLLRNLLLLFARNQEQLAEQ
jgi:hypothetical protein